MVQVVIYKSDGSETTIDMAEISHITVFGGELVVEYIDGRQESFGSDADIYFVA